MKTTAQFWLSVAVIAWASLFITHDVRAQASPSAERRDNVPDLATHEIARRGNHVELTGTIRSGLMAAALAPPADDSAKWFLTLIVKPGEVSSERMRLKIASDPALRPWVDVREPLKSTLHYHVRSIDDATQADWLHGLRPAIARSGLPLVVLQPPKNGQFGPTANIVKMVAGVVTGEQLATRLREGIIAYVQAIEPPPAVSGPALAAGDSGHVQNVIGVPPPFHVPPKDPPPNVAPLVPFDWPPVPTQPPPSPPPNPSPPASDSPSPWLALTALGTFVAGWVSARLKTTLGARWAAFARVIAILSQPPAPPYVPPGPSG